MIIGKWFKSEFWIHSNVKFISNQEFATVFVNENDKWISFNRKRNLDFKQFIEALNIKYQHYNKHFQLLIIDLIW